MDISRKTDYALRMLAVLVAHKDGIVSVKNAAEVCGVPYSFARSIQHDLVSAGMIDSLRGSRGGMRLAVDPDKITLLEVIEAVQGPITIADCHCIGLGGGPCERRDGCAYFSVWNSATLLLNTYFSSVSLSEVVWRSKDPALPMPYAAELGLVEEVPIAKEA
ncbi:MAG: Rrf2 family transcriptional regulator [Atopobiaceae bacterium]|nr:Rrf2 family transcriptional regulator [Atopobiaceae bacterium]